MGKGNALVARVLKVGNLLPAVFAAPEAGYAAVLQDLRYLKDPAHHERRIEGSPALLAIDDYLREVLFLIASLSA